MLGRWEEMKACTGVWSQLMILAFTNGWAILPSPVKIVFVVGSLACCPCLALLCFYLRGAGIKPKKNSSVSNARQLPENLSSMLSTGNYFWISKYLLTKMKVIPSKVHWKKKTIHFSLPMQLTLSGKITCPFHNGSCEERDTMRQAADFLHCSKGYYWLHQLFFFPVVNLFFLFIACFQSTCSEETGFLFFILPTACNLSSSCFFMSFHRVC